MAALFLSFIYTAKFYNPALSKNDSRSDTRQQYQLTAQGTKANTATVSYWQSCLYF
jgi:hypothetical protein